jgi:hypothetical protein
MVADLIHFLSSEGSVIAKTKGFWNGDVQERHDTLCKCRNRLQIRHNHSESKSWFRGP